MKNNKKILQEDTTFKYIFSYPEFANLFITEFFKFIKDDKEINIKSVIPQNLIFPSNFKGHKYYGDIIINTNDLIISLEMYQDKFRKKDYNKSYAYKCQLYANQIVNNKNKIDYQNFKKVVSINLINGNFKDINNNLVNKYTFKETKSLEEIDDGNTFIYLIRVDLIKKIPYTEDEDKFITLLRLFNATTFKELKNYAKGDEIMKNVINYVKEGIEQTAKKMKQEGIAAEIIHKVTGIPISKITML